MKNYIHVIKITNNIMKPKIMSYIGSYFIPIENFKTTNINKSGEMIINKQIYKLASIVFLKDNLG